MKLFELKRFFVVTLLLCLGVGQSWAGGGGSDDHSNHYGSITVTAAGNGSVYLKDADKTPLTLDNEGSYSWECEENSSNDQRDFYLEAMAENGYAFTGWSKNPNNNNTPNPDANNKVTLKASSTNQNQPSSFTYTANFAKINTFSATLNVVPVCNGTENIYATVSVAPYDSDSHVGYQEESTTETTKEFNFTLYAENNDKYEFQGWSTKKDATGNYLNVANGYDITCSNTDGEFTKNVTLYAIYKKKNNFKATAYVKASVYDNEKDEYGIVDGFPIKVDGKTGESEQIAGPTTEKKEVFTFELTASDHDLTASGQGKYEFMGWAKNPDGTPNLIKESPYKPTITTEADDVIKNDVEKYEYSNNDTWYAIYNLKVPFTATANVVAGEGGTVRIGEGEFGATASASQNDSGASKKSFGFTIEAKADDGYVWAGWTIGENTNIITTNPLPVDVTCSPATPNASETYYAHFDKLYYSKATVRVTNLEAGSVYVSETQDDPNDGAYETSSTATQESIVTEHTYYRWAEANIGYEFVGWCENEDLSDTPSTKGSFSFDVTNGIAQDNPVEKIYYAKFERTSNNNYLRNRKTGRFLKNVGSAPAVGNYPRAFDEVNNNNSTLHCQAGYVNLSGNTLSINNTPTNWTFSDLIDGKFVTISNNGMALSANMNEEAILNGNPNYSTVILDNLDPTKEEQQWEILTEPELGQEMYKANPENPVNVSWMLGNPNFDNIPTNGWNSTTIVAGTLTKERMTKNMEGGKENNPTDNPIGEFYIATCNQWTCQAGCIVHQSTWELDQTISKVPEGWYLVSCQAFQRVVKDGKTSTDTENITFYANDKNVKIQSLFALQNAEADALNGSTEYNGHKYPNSMSEASKYFLQGYYKNAILVHVDGDLHIGLKNETTTNRKNTNWCCFDNFQLYYLGKGSEQPTMPNDYTELDTRHTVKLSDDKKTLELTGLWRVLNEQELVGKMSEIEGSDEEKKAENSPLVIDATNATLIAKPTFPTPANPNSIIKVMDASKVANAKNVIDGENKSEYIELHDTHVLAPIKDVTAEKVTVKRTLKGSGTNGDGTWNTLCLPFDWNKKMLDGAVVKKLSGIDYPKPGSYNLHFSEVDENETLSAGTPYMVKVDGDEITEFSPKGEIVVNTTESALVKDNTVGNKTEGEVTFKGSFDPCTIPKGSYIISSNAFYFVDVYDLSSKGFRGWFEVANGEITGKVNALSASFDDDATGITSVNDDAPTELSTGWYNIAGQRVNENAKGIIIKNGKKYLVK